MSNAGWAIAALIIAMVVGLFLATGAADSQINKDTGCHYEYKMKNNKRVKVLDCG